MEDIKIIKDAIPSIEKIDRTVTSMNIKMNEIESKLGNLETRVQSCETSCEFISKEYDNQKTNIKTTETVVKQLERKCDDLKTQINNQSKQYDQQYEKNFTKMIDLESRSMRENLIFYGIPETNSPEIKESCENLVKDLIQNVCDIDPSNLMFDRAHRLGSNTAAKPRPIVVKFHKYVEREQIRTKSFEVIIKRKLDQINKGIGPQLPPTYT